MLDRKGKNLTEIDNKPRSLTTYVQLQNNQ